MTIIRYKSDMTVSLDSVTADTYQVSVVQPGKDTVRTRPYSKIQALRIMAGFLKLPI